MDKDKKDGKTKAANLMEQIIQEIIEDETALLGGVGEIAEAGIAAAKALGEELNGTLDNIEGKKVAKKLRKLGKLGKKAEQAIDDILGGLTGKAEK